MLEKKRQLATKALPLAASTPSTLAHTALSVSWELIYTTELYEECCNSTSKCKVRVKEAPV